MAIGILFDDLMITADPLMVRQSVTSPWDDFDDADGTPLIGRTTPSGSLWSVTGAGLATAVINSQGFVATNLAYAYLTDANPISETECVVSWTAVASQVGVQGTNGVIAFSNDPANLLTKLLHLEFGPEAWNLLKTLTGPGGLVPLSGTPVEVNGVPFTVGSWYGGPLKIDGTRYKIRMVADTGANTLTLYLPDGTVLRYTDTDISSIVNATVFWEHLGNGTTGYADLRFNGCSMGPSKAGSVLEACSNKDTALNRSVFAATADWAGQLAFPQVISKTTNGWYTIAQQSADSPVPKMGGTVTVFGKDASGVHCLLEIVVGAEVPTTDPPRDLNTFTVKPMLGAWGGGIVDQIRLSGINSTHLINLDISINNSVAVTLYAQYRGMFAPVAAPVVGATALSSWNTVLPSLAFPTEAGQWNPVDKSSTMSVGAGNLIATANATAEAQVRSVTAHSVGRFYVELTIGTLTGGSFTGFGLASASHSFTVGLGSGSESRPFSVGYFQSGFVYLNAVSILATNGNTDFSAGDTIGIAADLVNYKLYVKNITTAGDWNNDAGANPATGTNGLDISTLAPAPFFLAVNIETSGDSATLNAGNSAFAGAIPAGGYQAWG